jgi:hypothetical protein
MRTANVFMSAIHLIIIMLIFGMGAFFLTLYFFPGILFYFINLLMNNPKLIFKIGFSTLFLSFVLFGFFYMINKAQYLKFTIEKNKFRIDSSLIKSYIERFMDPDNKKSLEVNVLPKDKLEITATVDAEDIQKEFLLNIEQKVGRLLAEQLNYKKDFIFTLKLKK